MLCHYEKMKKLMNQSDIVLLVESFNQDNISDVQYSFSTKIIDCLQSGCGVMAIGPQNISAIEYLRTVRVLTLSMIFLNLIM